MDAALHKRPAGLPWWKVASWQVYEAGDSGWSLIVYTTYFSIFVQDVLHRGAVAYGTAATIGGFIIALLSPLLGAAVDISGRRQPYLRFFGFLTVILTALIGFTHSYPLAVTLFVLAYVAVNGGFNFFTSMVPAVSTEANVSSVISGAVGISYLSNIVLLGAMSVIAPKGPDAGLVFLPMAIIYLIYTLPAMFIAPDFVQRSERRLDIKGAYARIIGTLHEASKHKHLFRFLIADFVYENAVASVIALMVVYSRNAMGFQSNEILWLFGPALLVAGLSALLFGVIIRKVGAKKVLIVDLCVWLLLFAAVMVIHNKLLFICTAAPLAGIGLAGVWSASRTMLTALTPVDRSGEFWGLYNLSGRSAAVLGDFTWTTVLYLVGETVFGYKLAVGCLAVFIIVGLVLIAPLPDARPSAANVLKQ